jgi:hypothetical protein
MAVESPPSFDEATASYESWLEQQTTIVRADIEGVESGRIFTRMQRSEERQVDRSQSPGDSVT